MAEETRERLLRSATEEFVERGFDGARVDAIARRARVNKAMIYYHFGDKRALHQAVLLRLIGPVRDEIEALRASALPPRERLSAFYARLLRCFEKAPELPRLMVREVLAGGKHVDRDFAAVLADLVAFVASGVQQGVTEGTIRPLHPLLFHFSMIGPMLLYFATAGLREKVASAGQPMLRALTPEVLARHVQEMLQRGLGPIQESK
jgi:AcrR family transcriptional regulator